MATALTVTLVVVCGLLTVALLACLRGIAELRIRLTGEGVRLFEDGLLAGRKLPEELRTLLPWSSDDGLILFLSGDCGACLEVATLLPRLRIGRVAVAIVGPDGHLHKRIPQRVATIDGSGAEAIANELGVDVFPLAIHERDGVIVGTAYGEALESEGEIEEFWRAGGAQLLEEAS